MSHTAAPIKTEPFRIENDMAYATSVESDQPAQSDQSLQGYCIS